MRAAATGTGWYLERLLGALPDAVGIGMDVSKAALRRAARAHPRAGAVLADLWAPLPVADASVILNVFAPRNGPEFRRVLRPGGTLIVVTPATDHLGELIREFGLVRVDPDKSARVAESLADFTPVGRESVRRHLWLDHDELRTLIGMTPSARHVDLTTLPAADRTGVTVAVDVTTYR